MASYVFDIEADNLLPTVSRVHCIVAIDTETEEVFEFGPNEVYDGLELLKSADTLIGHNILGYDMPALKKLHGFETEARLIDTLVCARLIFSNIKAEDFDRRILPANMCGSHSLKTWGIRLGEHKAEYSGGFEMWSREMQDYCVQDVKTCLRLFRYLDPLTYSQQAIELEHRVARICLNIESDGWPFDVDSAGSLYTRLVARRDVIEKSLIESFGSWQEVASVLVPKRDDAKRGYTKGVPVTKYKTVVFNPGSRVHIEKKLKELGWAPEVFTDSGRAQLDEPVLSKIKIPEASLLVEFLLIQKRLGQIGDGDNGWLKLVSKEGKIHGRYNPNGAVTGRSTHMTPNVSQVPKCKAIYGRECRALFGVPDGWTQIGADMSGLELRCLSHYLFPLDKGEYIEVVTTGDVHTYHQGLANLDDREVAKTFIYAFLYGAGPDKIGKIIGGTAKDGKLLLAQFLKRFRALSTLKEAIAETLKKRPTLKGLDGRLIPVRSAHAALNMLLQSAGAVLCKQWLCNIEDALQGAGLQRGWDKDWVLLGWIHDEVQIAVRDNLVETAKPLITQAAIDAGASFGFHCPLASQAKAGKNWSETH